MGCTSSKATRHPLNQQEQIIPEHFRQWIETNRPEADEFLLKQIRTNQLNDLQSQDDYQTISRKIIDLLIQRPDIKTTQKLTKTLQKELPTIPLKTIEQTVEHLEKTFQTTKDLTTTTTTTKKTDEKNVEQILPGSPGKALKDALETARILFYKGKQAAIFANPHGGYDVRIVDEHDENQENLLRSIVVTEVKLRPKSSAQSTLLSEQENPLNENFRRSIDAALKGFQSIHQSSSTSNENHPMTYTEIIHSQSHDGEESRQVKSQTFDDVPPSPTSLQIRTKSEFSNDRMSNEKTMEQSVQVISVKVRNETKLSAHDEN